MRKLHFWFLRTMHRKRLLQCRCPPGVFRNHHHYIETNRNHHHCIVFQVIQRKHTAWDFYGYVMNHLNTNLREIRMCYHFFNWEDLSVGWTTGSDVVFPRHHCQVLGRSPETSWHISQFEILGTVLINVMLSKGQHSHIWGRFCFVFSESWNS